MLTVDDCNTILEKYKSGCWIDIDCYEIDTTVGSTYSIGPIDIEIISYAQTPNVKFKVNNSLWKGAYYFTKHDGKIVGINLTGLSDGYYRFPTEQWGIDPNDIVLKLYINPSPMGNTSVPRTKSLIIPLSPLQIPVIKGEYDNKFYFTVFIPEDSTPVLNGNVVQRYYDSSKQAHYILLPSDEDSILASQDRNGKVYPLYKITFIKFKELPIPYIPTLYKGTPQSIQVLNTEDDDPISDYQTYYQGRLLKDNIIHLPYDSDDYVDIMVDLKDYRYPFCTVKLKAPTTIYTANSQSDVETAIENGIQTLQVGDTETEVTLNSITLSNVTLINSNIQVSESILNDCQIIDTTYTDNGGNNITNTIFNSVDYTTTAQSNYNEVTFNECTIHDSEINLTGTVNDCTITDTLIISDGVINIQDNTFTGVGAKEYFPSHLYLTGEYTVIGNTFNLTGEWEELEYNMCLIKATNNFNPSQFINNNTLNLNITYDDEPTNTFYYNIVDDDKIRAVRL